MSQKKIKLIMEFTKAEFEEAIEKALEEGYEIIPGTLIINEEKHLEKGDAYYYILVKLNGWKLT